MIDRAAKRFHRQLAKALECDGWRSSENEPLVVPPAFGTFVWPTGNGWVVVLRAVRYGRDELDLPWLSGTHAAIEVQAWATFATAERLAASLGIYDADLGLAVVPRFAVRGQDPGYRQFGGPEDDEQVLGDVRHYARDVVTSAAQGNARLDVWLAKRGAPDADDPASDEAVVVMLLAYGRSDEALRRLAAARSDPRRAGDDAFAAFATRAERFARLGRLSSLEGAALADAAEWRARRGERRDDVPDPENGDRPASVVTADDEDDEETSGWHALGGLLLGVAFLVFVGGKILQAADVDIGWAWLPGAAAIVAMIVIRVGDKADELREGWRERVGSGTRVEEYLERKRRERLAERNDEDADDPNEERD